jgi:hypothetical protein
VYHVVGCSAISRIEEGGGVDFLREEGQIHRNIQKKFLDSFSTAKMSNKAPNLNKIP